MPRRPHFAIYSVGVWPHTRRLMLDPKLVRESPELVRAAIAKKHLDVDLDAVLALDVVPA